MKDSDRFTKTLFLNPAILILFMIFGLPMAGRAASEGSPKSVAIGTTSIGSATYVVSVGIAELISKHAGIGATAEVGGGADANARLMRKGKVQLAMLNSFTAENAYKGVIEFANEGKMPVRAIMWGAPSLRALIVRASSGIDAISDMGGKRILARRKVGADTEVVFNALAKAYGVDVGSVKILTYSRPKEIMDALRTGTADGAVWPISMENPNVMELQESVKLGFPLVSEDKWKAVLKELGPAFYMETVPANTYKNQPHDFHAPSIQMGLATTSDLSDEAVYEITKAILGHYDDLKLVHTVAEYYTPQNSLKQFCVPFHPGAIRYFKEIGAWTAEHDKQQQEVLALEARP